MSLVFLACVERGYLEEQVLLLCRSIRRFGGRWRHAPIHTFQPRRGTEIAHATRAALEDLSVTHHTQPLNTEYPDYALGNKVFVCAWAERNLEGDFQVFLDSDTIITSEPADLVFADGIDAAARPCNRWLGGISSRGPGDDNEPYWREAYRLCGSKGEPYVTSVVDGERVRAYFSSGLVAARKGSGIFSGWQRDFLTLMRADHIPPERIRIRQMDEISLAVCLGRAFSRLFIPDGRYNYLLYRRGELPEPWNSAQLDELVHVHYRFWFCKPGYLAERHPPLRADTPVMRWLAKYLPFTPVPADPYLTPQRRREWGLAPHA